MIYEFTKEEYYMDMALNLAEKGRGLVSPNPLVGAVIVKEDKVISTGYHKRYGDLHAEAMAIENATEDLSGSEIYVNLEPCSHYGNQPPCAMAIVNSGIKKVYIGTKDPNPLVAGKGIEILESNGIEVVIGVLEERCLELNKVFFHYIKTKRPYTILKYAMSRDGKIACSTGDSKWITNIQARKDVHETRNNTKAILVGVNTVITDNPSLNTRLENKETSYPIRILCDTNLRTPIESTVVTTAKTQSTIIATAVKNTSLYQPYEELGCKVIKVNKKNETLDIKHLLEILGSLSIDSLLIEGGGSINWSFVEENLIDEVHCYIGSIIIGGKESKSPVDGTGFSNISKCLKLKNISIENFSDDILIKDKVIKGGF